MHNHLQVDLLALGNTACVLADVSHVLPPFPTPDLGSCPLPEPISLNDVKKLQSNYRIHCEVLHCFVCFFFFQFLFNENLQTFKASFIMSGPVEGTVERKQLLNSYL